MTYTKIAESLDPAESERIRELHTAGLTDTQIAEALGLARAYVSPRRQALGLQPNGYNRWATPKVGDGARWTPKKPKLSEAEIAELYGGQRY